jgi:type I restriction enzyme S subunit
MTDTTLGAITLNIVDGVHGDCTPEDDSGFFFISVKDMQDFRIDYSSARQITYSDFKKADLRTKLEANDVLFANTGDTIGKMLRITQSTAKIGYTTFQKSVAILKPDTSKIDPLYFYYLIRFNIPGLRGAAVGSGQKNLLLGDMRTYKIRVPHDKSDQINVAKVLYAIDKKIETNAAINDNLQQMAHTAYMHLFFNKPANGKIGDILIENPKSSIQVGDAKDVDGDYPFFTSGDAVLRWSEFLVDGRNCYLNTGGNAGIKYYVGKAAYSTDTWCISAREGLVDYLYLLLDSLKQELSQKFFQGTGLKHLQKPMLKDRPIYIPSSTELESFNQSVIPWLTLISDNIRESQRLTLLRDWLLPMLMNGQATIED